ncbi:MAG: tetratricopeptide repeat protein, partial [bacterium]|nr:tetratricopeptide repeat protein [bacterium]
MDITLAQKAIDCALSGNWAESEKLNNQILTVEPENKEALNRLGRTCIELGKLTKALSCYKKVLKIDPYNSIAIKAVTRLAQIDKRDVIASPKGVAISGISTHNGLSGQMFLEEPGKTKTVSLLHLGDKSAISMLDAGEEVKLLVLQHKACINNLEGKYLGRLPDDIAVRLIKLAKSGSKYKAYLRSAQPEEVKVFIREVEKGRSVEGIPSFPTEKTSYISFTPPELIHDEKPDTRTPEEDF